jgi:metallo-beta-lactamase class B
MILRFVFATFATLLLSATLPAQTASDQHREFPAFKIAGNLYYVGTADLAVYLIHTPEGNILINSDFPQDVPLIKKSIASLGFKYEDTKILLLSHAHNDHDQAMGIIHKETGAKLMVMDGDAQEEESTAPGRPATHVDRVLHDGDTVELGGSKWIAKLTPGHTKAARHGSRPFVKAIGTCMSSSSAAPTSMPFLW